MPRLDLIFAGSGEFGLPTLERLAHKHRVVQVITQPDRPAGRGKKLTPTPIARFAEENKLRLLKTDKINAENLPSADVMVVIAFGQKISPRVVDQPRLGSVNLHASRLPRYRGAAPINCAILEGEQTSGNSVIRLAERMDAGAILSQSELPIGELETAGELHDRLARDGAPLVDQVLDALASGAAIERAQDESLATLAPKLSRESTVIDWNRDAGAICNQIRGLYPWPGCRVRIVDDAGRELSRVTLVRARGQSHATGFAGTILAGGTVASGNGAVEIVELQPEGKRPMSLDAYRNGHDWSLGMRLESIR